ncbi:MAG: LPS biosynthesis protein [Oceanospirillum sp.]|nr:LPS biosynthesis protein [Oceanospirillum sp.]
MKKIYDHSSSLSEKVCRQCLYPESHPLGLVIGEDGVCSGCKVHQEKYDINWDQRLQALKLKAEQIKAASRGKHDCVVYVDSDAESFYVVYLIKKVLGLEPLLVNFNDQFRTDIGYKNLHTLQTHFDCDMLSFTMRPSLYKGVIRESFFKYRNILWPALAARSALPVKVATQRGISTIVWGGHQGMEQVGMFSHHDYIEMSRWYRNEHDLFGLSESLICSPTAAFEERDLDMLSYPSDDTLIEGDIKGVYLNNYFLWDPLKQNKDMIAEGYTPEWTASTFDYFERSGSSVYYQIHDLLKIYKHGYAKVTDHLCREIRHERVSRAEAVDINEYYLKKKRDYSEFFQWLGLSERGLQWLEQWVLSVDDGQKTAGLKLPGALQSFCNDSVVPSERYLVFDKGIYLQSQVSGSL